MVSESSTAMLPNFPPPMRSFDILTDSSSRIFDKAPKGEGDNSANLTGKFLSKNILLFRKIFSSFNCYTSYFQKNKIKLYDYTQNEISVILTILRFCFLEIPKQPGPGTALV